MKSALEDWHLLLNWREVKHFGIWVTYRSRINSSRLSQYQLNWPVAFRAWCVYVNARWKLNFRNQGHPASWHDGAIGLRKGEPKVRRLYTLTHLLRQFRKKLANDIVRCVSGGIFCFEVGFANDSIFVT